MTPDQALREAVKSLHGDRELIARGARTPAEWAALANARAITDAEQETVIRRLTGHLIAHGIDPVLVLRLMEAFGVARFWPPMDPERVEELVAWVAGREADKLERRKR